MIRGDSTLDYLVWALRDEPAGTLLLWVCWQRHIRREGT